MGRASHSHTPVIYRNSGHEAPASASPLITCMLCRDLLHMSEGLGDFFYLQYFGELEVEGDKKKDGELLP